MNRRTLLLAAVLTFLLAACAAEVAPGVPPEIRYGEDVCDQCNMIISDARFAAGMVVEVAPGTHEHRIFDDIGDMLEYEASHGAELTVASYFVHDYLSREWIEGDRAYFVRSETLATPMGFGLAAFAERSDAEALARETNGVVVTLADLQADAAARSAADR